MFPFLRFASRWDCARWRPRLKASWMLRCEGLMMKPRPPYSSMQALLTPPPMSTLKPCSTHCWMACRIMAGES